jgi:hypothetical protein
VQTIIFLTFSHPICTYIQLISHQHNAKINNLSLGLDRILTLYLKGHNPSSSHLTSEVEEKQEICAGSLLEEA